MNNEHPFPPGAALAAYLRDSGGEEQELSVIQQESEIRAWCKARGLFISQVYCDAARPGSSTVGREAFHEMMEHFRNGASEAGVVIWRSNRLGRNVNDSQFYKADLRRRGYIVHSLMDDIPEGPAGQLVEFVLDWKDQVFLDQLSEDVKRGLRHNLLTHGVIPGAVPRGFRREPVHIGQRRDGSQRLGHRWVPDEETAPLVVKAFEMRAQGVSLRAIQKEIPLYKTVSCWSTFFSNEIYIGILHFGEITIPNYCPAMVPPEIWQAVQARKNIQVNHPRREGGTVLLSGLLECQICGRPMNYHTITGNHYYICSYRKRTGQCDARHIPAGPMDSEVIRLAREHILNFDNARALQARILAYTPRQLDTDKRTLRKTEAAHANLKKEIGHVMKAIRAYGHSDALFAELKALEQTESEQRAKIETLRENLKPAPEVSAQTLDKFITDQRAALDNPETSRAVLRKLIGTLRARRMDDKIMLQLEYIPPHQAAIRSIGDSPSGPPTG